MRSTKININLLITTVTFFLFLCNTFNVNAGLSVGLNSRPINFTCVVPPRPPSGATIALERATFSLGFSSPIAMEYHKDDPSKWVIAERRGTIRNYVVNGNDLLVEVGIFLDLSDRISLTFPNDNANEMGLLGFAFHPDFKNNGYIYVYYSANSTQAGSTHEARLSRFQSLDNGVTIDSSTEEVLIRLDHSINAHHWGGNLMFGPDGYLYLSLGDFGNAQNGQDTNTLPGSILRIDVVGGFPYLIPADNPFANGIGGAPEIYAWGLRNPWRGSFDSATGDFWLGDVGANEYEEVDRIIKGGNYGWPIKEGLHCINRTSCSDVGLIDPIIEYPHADGSNAVIGGYVYNGSKIPDLRGTYIYGDVSTGDISGIFYDNAGTAYSQLLLNIGQNIFGFSEGPNSELYVLRFNKAEEIVAAQGQVVDTFPALLSQTGCVDPGDPKAPASGLIPYSVVAPLWSDGAIKKRWIALPDWRVGNPTIDVETDGDFSFPIGTVLMKSFELNNKLIETRLFMRHEDGEWGGYSYEWNDEQTDATLLPGSKTKQVGNKTWAYPSRSQCFQCHTVVARRALGPELQQLNKGFEYPSTGITANQLWTMDKIGVFSTPLNKVPKDLPRLTPPGEKSGALGRRSRSWLHANCSYCHQPGGIGQGPMDFRYNDNPDALNAINVAPTEGNLGVPDAKIIFPGSPEKSILLMRLEKRGVGQMPPLGTFRPHPKITSLIEKWITRGIGMGVTDKDKDGWADNLDNCPLIANKDQLDIDGDGVGDVCDGG